MDKLTDITQVVYSRLVDMVMQLELLGHLETKLHLHEFRQKHWPIG